MNDDDRELKRGNSFYDHPIRRVCSPCSLLLDLDCDSSANFIMWQMIGHAEFTAFILGH